VTILTAPASKQEFLLLMGPAVHQERGRPGVRERVPVVRCWECVGAAACGCVMGGPVWSSCLVWLVGEEGHVCRLLTAASHDAVGELLHGLLFG
jgi:hypothetical protein